MSSNLSLDSLLSEVLSLAQKALNFDQCAVLLKEFRESDGDVLVLKAAMGYRDEVQAGMFIRAGEGITGRVLKTGKPILIPDVQVNGRYIEGVAGGRCEMATPLIVRDEVIGVLDAESVHANAFSEDDLKLFSTFAASAALALHNAEIHSNLDRKRVQLDGHVKEIARMHSELKQYAARIEETNRDLQKRIRGLETLQEASRAIASSLDLDQTLASILEMTRGIVDSSSCAIRLLDEEQQTQTDAPSGPIVQDGVLLKPGPPDAVLAVPLTIGSRLIGYFELGSVDRADFSEDDQRVLQVLASQAAIAIENARLFEHTQQTYYETIRSLAQALEARDSYTQGHSERVTRYALLVADQLDLNEHQRKVLHYAGMLHDIGKIGISDSILHKRVKLSDDEWETIRSHPLFGDTILGPIKFLSDAQQIVLHHHERYDGTGYPGRLRGDEIPLEARIIAVADAFDAMTSDRPYRVAMERDKALEEISNASGQQFDPQVVEAFLLAIEQA